MNRKTTNFDIRKGQAPDSLSREEFSQRFRPRFYDPAYDAESEAIGRLEDIAWQALQEGRKAPRTRVVGEGFADPAYPASVQWLETRERLAQAQARQADAATPSRVLTICGSARNDGTCLQGLRAHRDAAVPLALQLLPQPRAGPARRLDGRDLRALHGKKAEEAKALDRYLGYWEPYYDSHQRLDED